MLHSSSIRSYYIEPPYNINRSILLLSYTSMVEKDNLTDIIDRLNEPVSSTPPPDPSSPPSSDYGDGDETVTLGLRD